MAIVAVAAQDTTTSTGTGAVTLANVASANVINGVPATTFATAFTLGGTIAYPISQVGYQITDGVNTETGLGTLTSATVLTRDLILTSSNAGRHVNFVAGTKTVTSATTAFHSTAPNWTSVMPSTLPENDIQSGTFTATINAGSATATGTVRYKVSGSGQVTLSIPAISATAVGTTLTLTGIPAFLSPQSVAVAVGRITVNNVTTIGEYSFAAAGTVQGTGTATISQIAGVAPFSETAVFTTAQINGTAACVVTYDTF